MTKDEFIKAVNAVVDARIKKILPMILKKEMDKLKKELSEGNSAEIHLPDFSEIVAENLIVEPLQRKQVQKPKTYTKDERLNAVLQKTAEDLKSGKSASAAAASGQQDLVSQYKKLLLEQYENSDEGMETLNFNTHDMAGIANKTAMVGKRTISPAVEEKIEQKIALEIGKNQIEAATGNSGLGNIIMRDYRDLLKKVDSKVKSERPQG